MIHRLRKPLQCKGGVQLNSISNKYILDETPLVEDMFTQRASTDDGNAIGCALYGWHELAKRGSRSPPRHVYLGATYTAAVIALEPGCGRF